MFSYNGPSGPESKTHSFVQLAAPWAKSAVSLCILLTQATLYFLSYSVFDYIFSLFFVSGPCARLSWPSRQLLSAR